MASVPRSRLKMALGAIASGMLLGLVALLFPLRASWVPRALSSPAQLAPAMAIEAAAPSEAAQDFAAERADAAFSREQRSPIEFGLLTIPSTFSSDDGAYDLVVHFHGDATVVTESFARAGLNAAVAVVNLGTSSDGYKRHFAGPSALSRILKQTQVLLESRGLREAKLRRLALSAFSAGYAAVGSVLERPALVKKVDAVLLFDGLHAGYRPRDHSLNIERIAAFERFAKQAVLGEKLFSITHSEVSSSSAYASSLETTDKLLSRVGATRVPGGEPREVPELPSTRGRPMQPLVPRSQVNAGDLHVRGYAGDQKDDHTMHLLQMSVTAVPDLVGYWSKAAAR
jgi:hypothetical protein